MNLVFVDTSAWYEFADRRTPGHEAIPDLIGGHRGRMITSTFILAELAALIVARFDHRLAVAVGESIRSSPDVELIHPDRRGREGCLGSLPCPAGQGLLTHRLPQLHHHEAQRHNNGLEYGSALPAGGISHPAVAPPPGSEAQDHHTQPQVGPL